MLQIRFGKKNYMSKKEDCYRLGMHEEAKIYTITDISGTESNKKKTLDPNLGSSVTR